MTTSEAQPTFNLNPTQMHLLHLFSREMSEKELKELKMLLVEWYDSKAQEEMEKIWDERGLSNATMDEVLQSRHRSSPK